jgi:hypothetical protein
VTVISTNTTQGSVTRSGATLLWNIGTLNVGAGAQLLLTVQPPSFGSFVNSANTSAGTPDPNPDDDFKIATVNVLPLSTTLAGSFASSNQLFSISIPGPTNSGLTVIIQATTNLTNPNWVNIYTSTPPINFTDPASSNYVRRFYRAQLVP